MREPFTVNGEMDARALLSDDPSMLAPKQCKAARALLGWKQADLAERSGIPLGTVRDYEGARHVLNSKAMAQLVRAFQDSGLVLIFDDAEGGAGVRYRDRS